MEKPEGVWCLGGDDKPECHGSFALASWSAQCWCSICLMSGRASQTGQCIVKFFVSPKQMEGDNMTWGKPLETQRKPGKSGWGAWSPEPGPHQPGTHSFYHPTTQGLHLYRGECYLPRPSPMTGSVLISDFPNQSTSKLSLNCVLHFHGLPSFFSFLDVSGVEASQFELTGQLLAIIPQWDSGCALWCLNLSLASKANLFTDNPHCQWGCVT
jgi:hypothetical protein